MLTKRILTSVILITPLLFLVIFGSQFIFSLLVIVIIVFGLNEFYSLVLPDGKTIERIAGIFLGVIFFMTVYFYNSVITTGILSGVIFIIFNFFLLSCKDIHEDIKYMGLMMLGIFYISLFLSYFIRIRSLELGREWILLTFFGIWTGDTIAYFIGRRFGRHKLYSVISPNKTLEGSLGGLFGSFLGVIISKYLFFVSLSIKDCIFISLGLAFFGQIGDLCESMIKRYAGTKDSSNLLPGHGGILDRIDSLVFSAPFIYYYAIINFK